jgi:hypothetical protein
MKRAPNAFTPALVRWLSLDHVRLSAPPRTRERRVLDLLVRKKPDVDEKNRCHWKKLGQFNEDNIQVLGN